MHATHSCYHILVITDHVISLSVCRNVLVCLISDLPLTKGRKHSKGIMVTGLVLKSQHVHHFFHFDKGFRVSVPKMEGIREKREGDVKEKGGRQKSWRRRRRRKRG